ncbi:MAG: alanine racemase [Litorilituus sp.]|jgi:alanine racemase|nr:alanine racemase [Litorilituus sp.]
MSYHSRKTQAIINLKALKHNYQQITTLAPNSQNIAVIKANAYGHGAIEVAKSLRDVVPAFAVGFFDEAIALRQAGIDLPIILLEGPLCEHDCALAIKENLWLMLHNFEQLNWLATLSQPYTGKLWLKIDTGMSRLGFMPEEIDNAVASLTSQQQKNIVLCSHFSSAEELDNPKTLKQIELLAHLVANYQCQFSLANSAGIIHWPQSHGDYNRLGIALYTPLNEKTSTSTLNLIPAMTLQSTIIGLRDLAIGDSVGYGEIWQAQRPSRIATIAIGYGDGYPRNAKAGTPVWINGEFAPMVGRVSMDMITIDVTELANVNLGDCVELWGENLAVETVAKYLDTINYELLTRISDRVLRIYK